VQCIDFIRLDAGAPQQLVNGARREQAGRWLSPPNKRPKGVRA
jgi:hypothetical protein